MKPRIIILMHYLELGGAEMSLIGLLNALDPAKVDVDLFIYCHRGPLMKFIPKWVNLLPENTAYAVIESPIAVALKRGHLGVVAGRLMAKLKCQQFRRHYPAKGDDAAIMQYVGNYVTPWLPRINPDVEYDLCISYLTPHNIGRDKVRAKKRLAWIHTDYSTVDIDVVRELPVWGAYDHIASISHDVTSSFLNAFPSLSDRIIEIENILSADFVHSRAERSVELPETVRLLSIGRYCTAKNYDNVPDICRRLRLQGVDAKWYIIGFGGSEELIRQRIAEAGMEEHVILLGKKDNPYPYIKACDIYVQPSRYEGKSITVREAQILCKPVVVTNYPTASSQIKNGVDGVIVPLDNEGCARGLADFIADTALQQRIVDYLRIHDYANTSEVEKIYSLLK
ncbi:glycosyltransferase [Paramuribaculum intestinale]|uniref:glycosyltransferase n=1 Tax=Paramuribaculum intestinale TaxID=2094151 RepID=UPI0025B0ADE4|nr:glycosyltransferase [Paramuribaculum intestinale]